MMKKIQRHICHPFYWPAWLAIGLLWLLTKTLPYKILMFLGKQAGLLMLKLDKKGRHIAETNIKLCFPELDPQAQRQLLQKSFISVGKAIFEGCLAWWGSDKKLRGLVHFHGLEKISAADKNGKGILMLGVHFTTLEIIGRLFSFSGRECAIVYREHKNPLLNYLMSRARNKRYPLAIERNNVRAIIKTLKKGKIVWYTPDIDAGYYDHIFVPFFGIQTASLTATSRLAKITQANTMLSSYYRRDNDKGYDIFYSEKLDSFPSDDINHDITRINKLIEEVIRQKPEQYIWQYKRFKSRPNNEPRFYGKKK